MSNPITWKTISGPSMGDPGRSLAMANDAWNKAIGTLQGGLDKYNSMQDQNWQQGKENNTNAFLTRLSQFQTPEEAQAALSSGELAGMLQGFGAQVDQRLAADRMGSLVQTLQDRAMAAQQYEQGVRTHEDWRESIGQRDVVNGLTEALNRAETPEEVANIKEAIGIYQASNMLNSAGGNDLVGQAIQRRDGIVQRQRGDQEWEWKQANATHDAEMRPLEIQQAKANIKKANAAATGSGGKPPSVAAINAALEIAGQKDQSILSNPLFNGSSWQEDQKGIQGTLDITGTSLLDPFTGKTSFAPAVANKLGDLLSKDKRTLVIKDPDFKDEKGKPLEYRIPLTSRLMQDAIMADNGDYTSPSVDNTAAYIKNWAMNSETLNSLREFNKARLRAQGRNAKALNALGMVMNEPDK